MAECTDLSGGKYDTLIVASEKVEVDQTNSDLFYDATDGPNDPPEKKESAHLALYDVDQAVIDQSGSNIKMKGGSGVAAFNRIDGCGDVVVNQHNTTTHLKAGKKAKITAVNYITDTQGYVQNSSNSTVIVDGRGQKGGIVAHTVVSGDSNVTIRSTGGISIIRG